MRTIEKLGVCVLLLVVIFVVMGPACPWSNVTRIYYITRAGSSGNTFPSTWSEIAAGNGFSLGISTDGTLWGWGKDSSYQLGFGDATGRNIPTQSVTDTDWAALDAAGVFGSHAMALKADGTLWTWGSNASGQLGLGYTTFSPITATRVGAGTIWSKITVGGSHSLAISTTGDSSTLWAWGSNEFGQLGLGHTTSPISVPTQVGTGTTWAKIVGGQTHNVAISTTGAASTLWTWGNNTSGQLGLGHTTSPISVPTQAGTGTDWSKIATGSSHNLAISTTGDSSTLWAWGINNFGQLGLGHSTTPISVITQVGTDTDWAEVAVNESYSLAIKTDGTLWAWGRNLYGQLGDGSLIDKKSPVQADTGTDWAKLSTSRYHVLALKSDGTLWVWGNNDYGELGLGDQGEDTFRTTPTKLE